jgi:hypothetical protein
LKRLSPLEKLIREFSEPSRKEEEGKVEDLKGEVLKEEIPKEISLEDFLEMVKKENPRLYSTLKLLPSINLEGRTLKMTFDRETEYLKETISKNQTYLENKLKELTGNDFLIVLEYKENDYAQREELPPLLKLFLEEMNGKILSKKKIGKGEEDEEYF